MLMSENQAKISEKLQNIFLDFLTQNCFQNNNKSEKEKLTFRGDFCSRTGNSSVLGANDN